MHTSIVDRLRFTRQAVRGLIVFLFVFFFVGAAGTSPTAQTAKTDAGAAQRAVPLTAEARETLAQWLIANPALQQIAPGHRLAAIRVAAANSTDESGKTRTIVTAVLFDHTALEARRVAIDAASNEVVSNERLPGRPQSSPEEFQEAVQIVRRDADLARLLDGGAVVDGGFIVADAAGSRRRMIQLKLMSSNRHVLLRSITVDLTRREIASSSLGPAPADLRQGGGR